MNRGEGGVKERKYVSVQANQDKATDEKKSQNERRAATKSYVKVIRFVTPDIYNKKRNLAFQSARLL